jgi:hypothetical protein
MACLRTVILVALGALALSACGDDDYNADALVVRDLSASVDLAQTADLTVVADAGLGD